MKYEIISSCSKGNCTILEDKVAIDMGVSYKKLGEYAKKIKVVLLTHIHSDHFNVKTINQLSVNHPMVKFVCCKHLLNELSNIVPTSKIILLEANKTYDIGICKLSAFELKHDVPNVGWRIMINNQKCIYATDTTELNVSAKNYDLYLIESNYVLEQALNSLQQKQAKGEWAYEWRAMNNHLSKRQCDEFLQNNMGENSKFVYMHQHVERDKYVEQS